MHGTPGGDNVLHCQSYILDRADRPMGPMPRTISCCIFCLMPQSQVSAAAWVISMLSRGSPHIRYVVHACVYGLESLSSPLSDHAGFLYRRVDGLGRSHETRPWGQAWARGTIRSVQCDTKIRQVVAMDTFPSELDCLPHSRFRV